MRDKRTPLLVVVMVSSTLAVSAGCGALPAVDSASSSRPAPISTTTVRATVPTFPVPRPPRASAPTSPSRGGQALPRQFAAWAEQLPGTVAVSVAAVGGDSSVVLAPEVGMHVAWSTIKVPLSLAALRNGSDATASNVTAALTESDNEAAESLWRSLGDAAVAAASVQEVLQRGGDTTTTVQSARVRPGFTAFGQTVWPVDDQAKWAAQLPCQTGSASVMTPMRNVVDGQRWGFGAFPGAAIKGGWGPDETGDYLVRQLAILEHRSGTTAVSVAVVPSAGTFAAGIDLVNRVAQWVITRISRLPGGSCR